MTMDQLVSRKTGLTLHTLLDKSMKACVKKGLSYALWKLPGLPAIHFAASARVFRMQEVNLEESIPGFLFAPFDPKEEKVFLQADELFIISDGTTTLKGDLLAQITRPDQNVPETIQLRGYFKVLAAATTATPENYLNLVKTCQDAVVGGRFEKLVPSRAKEVTLPASFDLAAIFVELTQKYPAAMVSIFSSPDTGTWIGATPEMLVSVDASQRFHTAAVAGTQPFVPGSDLKTVTWTQKEIEEQALVERYIISCFKKIRLREFDEHGPRTVVAGNVVHLKTEFEVDMIATRYPQLGSVMLQLLHPTSAVCGMPMEQSFSFLREHEGYPREFYSGYLGPVKINAESHLFVNLRCMQVADGKARLYAGGGVLGDSDPDKEWQETELKLNTLLNVIRD